MTITGGCDMTAEPTPRRTLADLRKELKITQQQLADAMGVHATTVKRIEARYPNVMLPTIQAYLEGLGGRVTFTNLTTGSIGADSVIANPKTAAMLKGFREDRSRAIRPSASAEELPLQGDQPESGSDDPSRDVDEPDPDSNQGDGSNSQQA